MPGELCRHFRARSMFVPGRENDFAAEETDFGAVRHCWCNRTMTEIGLDDERVEPAACSSGARVCYEVF